MTQEEINAALMEDYQSIEFEEVPEVDQSPLNQPVIEKDIGGNQGEAADHQGEPPPYDAPEQFDSLPQQGPKHEAPLIPMDIALAAADAYLGAANNFLEIGAGFFVKVKHHPEFLDFEEVVQVIDEQNHRNVQRVKLDEEDKALLRPLLAMVIQKRAKGVSPEGQLLTALISILIKKVQVVVQIRAENKAMETRILSIIQQQSSPEPATEEPEASEPTANPDKGTEKPEPSTKASSNEDQPETPAK